MGDYLIRHRTQLSSTTQGPALVSCWDDLWCKLKNDVAVPRHSYQWSRISIVMGGQSWQKRTVPLSTSSPVHCRNLMDVPAVLHNSIISIYLCIHIHTHTHTHLLVKTCCFYFCIAKKKFFCCCCCSVMYAVIKKKEHNIIRFPPLKIEFSSNNCWLLTANEVKLRESPL